MYVDKYPLVILCVSMCAKGADVLSQKVYVRVKGYEKKCS